MSALSSAWANGLSRAFVAIVPPREVVTALDEALTPVRAAAAPRLTWTRRAQWHVTLQFLGRVDDVASLVDALALGLADAPVARVGLGGAGAFPSPIEASVVWIGIDQGADELETLARVVESASASCGCDAGDGPTFTPHITMARARHPLAVGSMLGSIGDGPIGPMWNVTEVRLLESDTLPSGAAYREVARFPLSS
ncbi:MAG: RNA 2',3'-cyclic phosphodiesterase [Acidimicrobiia bacterium]|jgi:RNA 2',3'-cyclic 3'-phosphodiesterase